MIAWQAGRAAVDRLAARGVLQRLAGTGADIRIAEMPDGIAHYVSLVSHYVSFYLRMNQLGVRNLNSARRHQPHLPNLAGVSTFLIWQA